MLSKLEDSVQEVAGSIVTMSAKGEIDFIVDVAAALPLKSFGLDGYSASYYQEVFDCSNVILGAGDSDMCLRAEISLCHS